MMMMMHHHGRRRRRPSFFSSSAASLLLGLLLGLFLLSGASASSYISYNALTADSVPCSTAGASYYNCASSGPANPNTRSCTTITRCTRSTSR